MHSRFAIVPLLGRHLMEIRVQASQRMQLGKPAEFDQAEADATAGAGEGYAVIEGDRVAACYGLMETWPGRQAVAWAFFAEQLGDVHLALSRHARARVAASKLDRIEAVAIADIDAMTLPEALAKPTPEMRWAAIVGLKPVHLLRKYGGAGETMVYYERVAA